MFRGVFCEVQNMKESFSEHDSPLRTRTHTDQAPVNIHFTQEET